jgi:hypothetical protein
MEESTDFPVPRTEAKSTDYQQLFCEVTQAIWPDMATDELADIAQGTAGALCNHAIRQACGQRGSRQLLLHRRLLFSGS